MPEAFQVIFNSQGSKNVLNKDAAGIVANINAVVYNVNWAAFLPKKYKTFHCQFVFKSQNFANLSATDNGFLNMNLGRVSVFDGQQMSTNLGIVYPINLSGSATGVGYYNSTNNDSNDFWIDYPINNTVTVTLNAFGGGVMRNMPAYVVMLNLIGIDDEEVHLIDQHKRTSNIFMPNIIS